ncbi:hypothetical protein BJY04DRAFT_199852 [Aspergillus karnatakaensis]|uniref:putative quinol monooxygenase n=1 Tax=Aspergillus karnatakaensis TaxID=1810916 RepID=UPI003CCD2EF1
MADSQSSPPRGFALHVSIFIAPENVPKFFEAFEPAYKKVAAEPECTLFEVYQDPNSPGELSWVEHWTESLEWFMEVQVNRDYYAPYLAVTEPMFLKPREFKILHRVGAPYSVVKKTNGEIRE